MYRIYLSSIVVIVLVSLMVTVNAAGRQAPTEFISNITYIKKGGDDAIRVDLELPVNYVSHFPTKKGDTLTINLRINRADVDTSQLPLLQTYLPPSSSRIPLTEATYLTDSNQPQVVLKFSRVVTYSVSQSLGITSLVISLADDTVKGTADASKTADEGNDEDLKLPAVIEDSKGAKGREEKMFLAGRRALRSGDNNAAVQIFSALLGMPDHKYIQDSLELLGLARERNGQQAHAKSAYSEYLERYGSDPKIAKDDKNAKDVQRVKQRLADLVSVRVQPKDRLKKTDKMKAKEDKSSSTFFSSLSQNVNYANKSTSDTSTETSVAQLENDLSFNWRVKSGNYDVRTAFSGSVDYDTQAKEGDAKTEGLISSFYSAMKNSTDGVYATVGRQSARTSGIGGKFDGFLLGYDIVPKLRFNTAYGFLVGYQDDKTKILVDQPFVLLNFEMNDLIKGLDFSPYVSQEKIFEEVNRQIIGTDIRFFHKNGDIYGIYEYDQVFEKTSFFRLQSKFNYLKDTTLNFSYEKRQSPQLALQNALLGLPVEYTIETLLAEPGIDLNYLKEKALTKTGESTSLTVGLSHSFSDVLHMTLTVVESSNIQRIVVNNSGTPIVPVPDPNTGITPEPPVPTLSDYLDDIYGDSKSNSTDVTLQLVTSASLHPQDSTIFSLRNNKGDNGGGNTFSENSISFDYRRPYTSKLRISTKIQYRMRENTSVNSTTLLPSTDNKNDIVPSLKLDYAANRDLRWNAEISYNNIRTIPDETGSGAKDETVEQALSIYAGYNLNF